MRQIWTIVVIVSFISVLSGSFISMAYSGTYRVICLATQLNGSEAPCPEADPIGFANFHGEALRKFSNVLIVDGPVLLYAIVLLAILMLGTTLIDWSGNRSAKSVAVLFSNLRSKNQPLFADNLNWFSLHENSPSLI
ncbi:MAG: hypothetical protein HYT62_01610 [Candidatus Yanofskybacteria bacterium]|nr:hypothetical protein [Candidatus Yanofskybacteria bacterium]